jgi:coenzyme F420-reducing hydrogenase delta subunit
MYTMRCRILFCIHHNHLEAHHKSTSECQQEKLESADNFYYVISVNKERIQKKTLSKRTLKAFPERVVIFRERVHDRSF